MLVAFAAVRSFASRRVCYVTNYYRYPLPLIAYLSCSDYVLNCLRTHENYQLLFFFYVDCFGPSRLEKTI